MWILTFWLQLCKGLLLRVLLLSAILMQSQKLLQGNPGPSQVIIVTAIQCKNYNCVLPVKC